MNFLLPQADVVAELTVAGDIGSRVTTSTQTISTSGNVMTRAYLCPNASPPGDVQYTATPAEIRILFPPDEVDTLTRE